MVVVLLGSTIRFKGFSNLWHLTFVPSHRLQQDYSVA